MKISDFIGKTVKEIVFETREYDRSSHGVLVIFNDGSKILCYLRENPFFDQNGEDTIDDIQPIGYAEFFSKLR